MMGIDGFIKSVFKTVPAELNFNAIAGALKNAYGIEMKHHCEVYNDQYVITLEKDRHYLNFTISRYDYEDGKYEFIIRENVDRFRKELDDPNRMEQVVLDAMTRKTITMSGANPKIYFEDDMNAAMDSIVLNDLKKAQEAEDMLISKFSDDDKAQIERLKTVARSIGCPGKTAIIAGGFFASTYWGEEPKDIDIFYLDGEYDFKSTNIDLTLAKINDDPQYLKNPMITKVISFSVTKRQLIFTKYETRRELIDHFDMLHCCVSYDREEDKLYISPAALDAIKTKTIRPNGSNEIAEWRLAKMKQKGWKLAPSSV